MSDLGTLRDFAAGRIDWPAAVERLGIGDEDRLREALVDLQPWTWIVQRYGVSLEAVVAVYVRIEPRPLIWPEAVPEGYNERLWKAMDIVDGRQGDG